MLEFLEGEIMAAVNYKARLNENNMFHRVGETVQVNDADDLDGQNENDIMFSLVGKTLTIAEVNETKETYRVVEYPEIEFYDADFKIEIKEI
jgi:hypothetical protein